MINMKTLNNYLNESLLDDLDDLDNNSDLAVKRSFTIGDEYEVSYMEDAHMINIIDKNLLKTIPTCWDDDDFWSYRNMVITKHKPNQSEIKLANILLSSNKDLLKYTTNIPKNNDFYININKLYEKHIKKRGPLNIKVIKGNNCYVVQISLTTGYILDIQLIKKR